MNINKTGKFLGAPGGADAFDDHVDPTITVSDRIGMTDSKRGIAQLESLKRDASDAGTMAGEGKRLNSGVGGPTELARTISVDDDDATPTPTPRTRASLDVAFTADDVDGEEVRVAVEKPEASTRDPTRPGGDAFAPPTEKAKGAGGTFIAGAFRIGADVHYVEKKSDAPFAPGDLRDDDEDASDRGTKTTKSTRFEDPADMLRARTRESNPTEAAHGSKYVAGVSSSSAAGGGGGGGGEGKKSLSWSSSVTRSQVSAANVDARDRDNFSIRAYADRYLIDPNGRFMVWWDVLIFTALAYTASWTPYEVAFEVRSSITPVPIRPRSRGERRSLRTFSSGASLRPGSLAFNPYTPRRLPFNSASDAFQLHPDVASYGPSTPRRTARRSRSRSRPRSS